MRTLALSAALAAFLAGSAYGGQIGSGDFGPGTTTVGYGLGLPFDNPTPIDIEGDTYGTDSGLLRCAPSYGDWAGGSGSGLGTNTDTGYITIYLGTPTPKAGLNVGLNYPWSATVDFYNESDSLLGTVEASGEGGGTFVGWQADTGLVAKITVRDTAVNDRIICIDNLMKEGPVPEYPVLSPIPQQWAEVGQLFTYDVEATGDPAPSYSLTSAPAGMTIDAVTGMISWTPTEDQTGSRSVRVKATNPVGWDEVIFGINVSLVPPKIVPIPDQTATVGHQWKYRVELEAGSLNPAPEYSLTIKPSGMGITGDWMAWTPTVAQLGVHQVTVRVANSAGADTDSFTVNVEADTEPHVFELRISSSDTGVYPNDGGSVTTPGEGSFMYAEGAEVSIVASANSGYHFLVWIGSAVDAGKVADPLSPTTTVVMHGNYAVEARFEIDHEDSHKLSVWTRPGGDVLRPGGGYFYHAHGSTVTIEARAGAGYHFVAWTGSAVAAGKVADPTSPATTLVMDADYTLAPEFEAGEWHTLSISSSNGGQVSTPGEGLFEYEPGTVLSVTAQADSGYRFSGWTGTAVNAGKVANSTTASTNVTIDADYTLVANFESSGSPPRHSLIMSSTGGGYVSTPGEGTFQYDEGTSVSISARASEGYQFSHWSGTAVDAGKVANPRAHDTVVVMAAAYTLVANFEAAEPDIQHTLTITSTAGGYVLVPGTGVFTYDDGAEVSITAQADSGYYFSHWTGTAVDAGRVANPISPSTMVAMNASFTLHANFVPASQVSLRLLTPNGGESLTAGGAYFVRWETEGNIDHINIDISIDGGSTWTQVTAGASGGQYSWVIPPLDSDRCLVRISSSRDPVASDVSDALFSIRGITSQTWYVDAAANPGGDGASWAHALVSLQDALSKASAGDNIWVAAGLYWPDLGIGQTVGDRTATFQLKSGVAIFGGFPVGGSTWAQRNPLVHPSILSGDIGVPGRASDNSYHIVTAGLGGHMAVLDGCVITHGCANAAEPHDRGAGMYSRGSPLVRNCIFVANAAVGDGGGAYNSYGSPAFINCVFSGNTAGNCGGGLYSERAGVTITNCTFTANDALWRAGGVFDLAGTATLTNCILWGNSRLGKSSYAELAQISGDSPPVVNHCCIQNWTGSLGGSANIGRDPLFADADGSDDVAGTLDDDVRLQAGSPCIDAGDNAAVWPEITTDLQGWPRILRNTVDIGACEYGEAATP